MVLNARRNFSLVFVKVEKQIPISVVQSENSTSNADNFRKHATIDVSKSQRNHVTVLRKPFQRKQRTNLNCELQSNLFFQLIDEVEDGEDERRNPSTYRLSKQLFRRFPVRPSTPFTVQDYPESENKNRGLFQSKGRHTLGDQSQGLAPGTSPLVCPQCVLVFCIEILVAGTQIFGP